MLNNEAPEPSPGLPLPAFPHIADLTFTTLAAGEAMLGRIPEELLGDVGLNTLLQVASDTEVCRDALMDMDQRLSAVQAYIWAAIASAVSPPRDD